MLPLHRKAFILDKEQGTGESRVQHCPLVTVTKLCLILPLLHMTGEVVEAAEVLGVLVRLRPVQAPGGSGGKQQWAQWDRLYQVNTVHRL